MDLLVSILHWLVVALGLSMIAGTAISWMRSPHWFVRGWDFPRVQITSLLMFSAVLYAAFFARGEGWVGWAFVVLCVAGAAWQFYRIFPYLPIASSDVERATEPADAATLRLVASNVLQENDRFDHWLDVIRGADPDVILAVEVDERWDEALSQLEEDYPYAVRQPQDNYYGMVLYSRLKLVDREVNFLVEDDVPSIHAVVELGSGQHVHLHGVHPRPPEPLRDEDATSRDAEVVIVGREIDAENRPAIVAGDFNDVAWSHTSELFQRVSGLLDPRKGRGFFNSFDARYPLIRWPLDHVFHSNHFKLVELELLPFVGSDHFPVFLALDCEMEAQADQPEPEEQEGDEEEAQEKVDRAVEEQGSKVLENEGACRPYTSADGPRDGGEATGDRADSGAKDASTKNAFAEEPVTDDTRHPSGR